MSKKNNSLKIAVHLYGHLRTYNECFPALNKPLLDNYDCDVFIHTWDTLDHSTKAWHQLNEGRDTVYLSTEKIKEEITRMYNPKRLKIETQKPIDMGLFRTNYGQEYSLFGIHSMLHGMEEVNKLRLDYEDTNKIDYDYVIFTRPDILFKQKFEIKSFTKSFSPEESGDCIFVCGVVYGETNSILHDLRLIGGKDLLFFGSSSAISCLFKNVIRVKDHLKEIMIQKKITTITEYFFYKLLLYSRKNIIICNFLLGRDYTIRRLYSEAKLDQDDIFSFKYQLKKYLPFVLINFLRKLNSYRLLLINRYFS